jgi:hypothetical protein
MIKFILNNQIRIQTTSSSGVRYCGRYRSVQSGSNADATARSDQAIGLQPAQPTTLVHRGGSARGADATACIETSLDSLYLLDLDYATLVFSLSL